MLNKDVSRWDSLSTARTVVIDIGQLSSLTTLRSSMKCILSYFNDVAVVHDIVRSGRLNYGSIPNDVA